MLHWVYAKYPHACAKCGGDPCVCVQNPWIFENRREDPEPYEPFREEVAAKKSGIGRWVRKNSTTEGLIKTSMAELTLMFWRVYRAQRWGEDPWKLAMHLVEELGEATIALSRLQLLWIVENDERQSPAGIRDDIRELSEKKVKDTYPEEDDEAEADTDNPAAIALRASKLDDLRTALRNFDSGGWTFARALATARFKEELADVLSWLCAVVATTKVTEPGEPVQTVHKRFQDLIEQYTIEKGRREAFLGCPWCEKPKCDNDCLIAHAVAGELSEEVTKF